MLPKVVLYGAGERGRRLCKLLQQLNCEMAVTIVDSNFEKWGTRIGKWTVKSPDILRDLENVKLHITIADDDIIKEIRLKLPDELKQAKAAMAWAWAALKRGQKTSVLH